MGNWGGKREGAGRPKGSESPETAQKRENRQVIRAMVEAKLAPIVEAQIANAQGVSYMMLRHPDGSFTRVTDEKQIDAACAAGSTAVQLFTQQPHQATAAMLLAYAADKPVEPLELSGPDGETLSIDLLLTDARKRLARLGRSEAG